MGSGTSHQSFLDMTRIWTDERAPRSRTCMALWRRPCCRSLYRPRRPCASTSRRCSYPLGRAQVAGLKDGVPDAVVGRRPQPVVDASAVKAVRLPQAYAPSGHDRETLERGVSGMVRLAVVDTNTCVVLTSWMCSVVSDRAANMGLGRRLYRKRPFVDLQSVRY
jgi:hypothetical protein